MGVKTVHLCDVCGIEPKDDDLSTWRTVNIAPLMTPPQAPVRTDAMAMMGALQPPPETSPAPTHSSAMVCHKPSCLLNWAKEQNKNKEEPVP